MYKTRPYKALDKSGRPIITVLAHNAAQARKEVLEQLNQNPSRHAYKSVWRKGHCALQTDTGITLYWCSNMGRFVTIPADEPGPSATPQLVGKCRRCRGDVTEAFDGYMGCETCGEEHTMGNIIPI